MNVSNRKVFDKEAKVAPRFATLFCAVVRKVALSSFWLSDHLRGFSRERRDCFVLYAPLEKIKTTKRRKCPISRVGSFGIRFVLMREPCKSRRIA